MASCKEGAEFNKDKEVYLTSSFKVRESQYEVSLSSTHIEWTDVRFNKLSVSVPVREVINVKLEDSSEVLSQFTVHYITKSPNKIWKVADITFRSGDKGLCQQWVDKLQYAANQPEFERPKNLLVIINPVSGKKKSVQDYRKIVEPVLQLADIKTTVHITDHGGHAKEIVTSCDLDSFDGHVTPSFPTFFTSQYLRKHLILSLGGDGTCAECFSGLLTRTAKECGIDLNDPNATLQTPKLRIGALPTGTANGLVATATGTSDILTMTLHVVAGYSIATDILTVYKDKEFVAFSCVIVGQGYFADTIKESESRRWMGRARYVYAPWKAFAQHRLFNCELQYLPFQEGPEATQSASDSGLADCSQAMSEVQLAMEGEGTTTNSDWQSVKYQSFCAVTASTFDLKDLWNFAEREKQCDGAIYLDAVKACSRTKLFSYLLKLRKSDPDLDSQHVDRLKVLAYRVLTPRAMEGASTDHFDDYMNIDGEFVPLKEPHVIEVWNHNKLMRLFGAGAWFAEEEKC